MSKIIDSKRSWPKYLLLSYINVKNLYKSKNLTGCGSKCGNFGCIAWSRILVNFPVITTFFCQIHLAPHSLQFKTTLITYVELG